MSSAAPPELEPREAPRWTSAAVAVVFVLGGPGAGKGTQCARLVRDFGFTHLSAGDLLRAEQDRPGSQFGDMIRTYIKEGNIVPMEVTIQLLENAMAPVVAGDGAGGPGRGKFLIDGFPRKLDQAHTFEARVVPSSLALFLDCPEAELQARLLNRGKTSGRADDNPDSIRKRFRTFVDTSMPVVDELTRAGKVVRVEAVLGPDQVYEQVKGGLAQRGLMPVALS